MTSKMKIGARTALYPMPTVLVGANVDGKPNYLTAAYCGIVNYQPPMLALSLHKTHRTSLGIRENGTFSVNLPSTSMVEVTDYVGIVSGDEEDKSNLFENFYGDLGTAPMIAECPLNLECKLVRTLNLGGTNELFVGEILETYTREEFLTNGLPDIQKLDPIIFSIYDNHYWKLGNCLGSAWSTGKVFKRKPA
jgi:flavin reductase (DIM6/NTAB) family NADH-FMN oxidoreductase RutF